MRWPFAFAVILAISSILFGQTATYPYVLKTFAGAFPIADGDGGPATSALLYNPRAVAPDAAGNLYVIDYGPLNLPRLRVVTSDGNINLVSALQN